MSLGPAVEREWAHKKLVGGVPAQVVVAQKDGADWLCTDSLEGNLMTELKGPGRSSYPLLSQTVITDGNWHRIGFVWDGLYSTLYVDDIVVAEDSQDSLDGSDSGLYLGSGKAMEVGTFWPGLIDVVRLDRPRELKISSLAAGRCDFQKIEVIYNGRVVQSASSQSVNSHFEARITKPLWINEPGWIALRISSEKKNEMGAQLLGHTSAVYVEIEGKTIFKTEVAKKLIADMNDAIRTIREKANFADDKQADEILRVYREGIESLRKRLKKQ